jgi:hypothetical protein
MSANKRNWDVLLVGGASGTGKTSGSRFHRKHNSRRCARRNDYGWYGAAPSETLFIVGVLRWDSTETENRLL